MRTPFNYSVRRVAREAANNYARGRNKGGPPEPDGCGCVFWFVVIFTAFYAWVKLSH
jgi:hypothetical protein